MVNVLIKIGSILAAIALLSLVIVRFFSFLRNSKYASERDWVRALSNSFKIPLLTLIWGLGLTHSLQELLLFLELPIKERMLMLAQNLFILFIVVWAVYRWKNRFENIIIEKLLLKTRSKSNQALTTALSKLSNIVLFIIAVTTALQIMGVPLNALLAFGGIGGLAISWAGKDIIANFFGGFMIYVNRHFAIGDWIKSTNKNFEGVVEDIGWYMTRIRTLDRRPTYIPNSLITDAIIENPGRMYNRRIRITVGLRYDDIAHVHPVAQEIQAMLEEHEGIDQNQRFFASFSDFNSCSLDIDVSAFTRSTDYDKFREVKEDVLLKIADIVEQHKAEFAFPTSTIHLQQGTSS